jgi:hypothetical protein
LKPTNRFGSPEGSLKHFVESRSATENFLKDTPDLRAHAVHSPIGGPKLDAYEWVLFVSAHSQRHTRQIEEVKADEFPEEIALRRSGLEADVASTLYCAST